MLDVVATASSSVIAPSVDSDAPPHAAITATASGHSCWSRRQFALALFIDDSQSTFDRWSSSSLCRAPSAATSVITRSDPFVLSGCFKRVRWLARALPRTISERQVLSATGRNWGKHLLMRLPPLNQGVGGVRKHGKRNAAGCAAQATMRLSRPRPVERRTAYRVLHEHAARPVLMVLLRLQMEEKTTESRRSRAKDRSSARELHHGSPADPPDGLKTRRDATSAGRSSGTRSRSSPSERVRRGYDHRTRAASSRCCASPRNRVCGTLSTRSRSAARPRR